jgi:ABC-type oligopeptide transport system ATPase subunit
MAEPLLEVRGLVKHFPITRGVVLRRRVGAVKAVDGIDLRLMPGETLGLVGETGCGKSTTARLIMRLLDATGGEIHFQGRDITRLHGAELRAVRRDVQMIFQDPYSSLNPRKTVGTIIGEPFVIHRLEGGAAGPRPAGRNGDASRRRVSPGFGWAPRPFKSKPDRQQRRRKVQELMDTVGLNPEHYNRYPHEFSGGQRQRVGVARALALAPKLLIADEPVSALDVSIQAQILNLLRELQRDLGLALLFISHDLSVVRYMCERVAVMHRGKVVETGPAAELYRAPRDPYTRALLAAVPKIPDYRRTISE